MASFSKDIDILKYESILFGELHPPGQVLISGSNGVTSGTTFTSTGSDFTSASVEAGGVIYLRSSDGAIDGVYEIVAVDSATQLSISVLRELSTDNSVGLASATNVFFRVSTYKPQIGEAEFELTEYLGIKPGDPDSDYDSSDVLDTGGVKRMTVFLTLSRIYSMLASKSDSDNSLEKSQYYQRLYEKSRERSRVSLDVGSDGQADVEINGGSIKLKRD